MRIYFVGAHSTGKTTIARQVAERLRLPFISECARAVLAEWELSLDSLRIDVELVKKYQMAVAKRQFTQEEHYKNNFVSDRSFDHVVYAANHSMAANSIINSDIFVNYMDSLKDPEVYVFFVRPHISMLNEDGTRAAVSWEEVLRIDGMVKFAMEIFDINYISMSCENMQERLRMVSGVLKQRL